MATASADANSVLRFAERVGRGTARGVEAVDYLEMHLESVGDAPLDEVHAEDLWYAAMQFTEPRRREEIRENTLEALDAVAIFLDSLVELTEGEVRPERV